MKDFFKKFESINAMVAYLDNAKVSDTWGWHHCSSQSSGDPDDAEYYGYDTYAEAREMVLKGDKNLAKKLRGTDKLDVNIPMVGTRKKMVTQVVGFMPHVPNYLAGVPNNMIFCKEKKAASPILTIVYNIGCLSSSSGDEVTAVSARIMSAIMGIERKGIRVNLYVASAQKQGSESCGMVVKIKDSGQHIDTLKMAVPMISPAMNRRFGFRFRETMEGLSCDWVGGYGYSMDTANTKAFLDRQGFKYDVAIAYESVRRIKNVEQLERMFTDAIEKNKFKN